MIALLLASIVPVELVADDRCDVAEVNKTTPLLKQRGLTTCSVKENEMAEMILDGVRFKTIPGFSRYYAGEDGLVGTFMRKGNPNKTGPFRLITQSQSKGTGYLYMTLSDDNRKLQTITGHTCVLLAFVGPRPDGMEACHDPDPCRSNNKLANLRWDTRKGNHADKWKHGTQQAGSRSAQAILAEVDVLEIKRRLVLGHTLKSIAADYGVDWTTIGQIRRGKNWGHIAPELHAKFPPSYRSRRFGVNVESLADQAGISKACVYARLKRGFTLDEALSNGRLSRKAGAA